MKATCSFLLAVVERSDSSDLEDALESLATLDDVSVAFHTGTSLCTEDGTEVASVTFVAQHGDVPSLTADFGLLVDDGNGGVSQTLPASGEEKK